MPASELFLMLPPRPWSEMSPTLGSASVMRIMRFSVSAGLASMQAVQLLSCSLAAGRRSAGVWGRGWWVRQMRRHRRWLRRRCQCSRYRGWRAKCTQESLSQVWSPPQQERTQLQASVQVGGRRVPHILVNLQYMQYSEAHPDVQGVQGGASRAVATMVDGCESGIAPLGALHAGQPCC
jgi:hypothetical protein